MHHSQVAQDSYLHQIFEWVTGCERYCCQERPESQFQHIFAIVMVFYWRCVRIYVWIQCLVCRCRWVQMAWLISASCLCVCVLAIEMYLSGSECWCIDNQGGVGNKFGRLWMTWLPPGGGVKGGVSLTKNISFHLSANISNFKIKPPRSTWWTSVEPEVESYVL